MFFQHVVCIGALLPAASGSRRADMAAEQVREALTPVQPRASAQLAGKDLSDLDLSRVDIGR